MCVHFYINSGTHFKNIPVVFRVRRRVERLRLTLKNAPYFFLTESFEHIVAPEILSPYF